VNFKKTTGASTSKLDLEVIVTLSLLEQQQLVSIFFAELFRNTTTKRAHVCLFVSAV